MNKWIKIPAPGEFRGEGEWMLLKDCNATEEDWEYCKKTGWLPVHEGEEKPHQ